MNVGTRGKSARGENAHEGLGSAAGSAFSVTLIGAASGALAKLEGFALICGAGSFGGGATSSGSGRLTLGSRLEGVDALLEPSNSTPETGGESGRVAVASTNAPASPSDEIASLSVAEFGRTVSAVPSASIVSGLSCAVVTVSSRSSRGFGAWLEVTGF